jgi:hypothetical protein
VYIEVGAVVNLRFKDLETMSILSRTFVIGGIVIAIPLMAIAGGFTVKQVIRVGPISSGAMYWPAVWSPDGSALAYVSAGEILVADTMGNTRRVAEFGMTPYDLVWVSDNEVAISGRIEDSSGLLSDKLLTYRLTGGEPTVVASTTHRVGRRTEGPSFKGPYRTVEGEPYFEVIGPNENRIEVVRSSETKSELQSDQSTQHVIHVSSGGVFLKSLDNGDSVLIPHVTSKELKGLPIQVNKAKTFALFRKFLVSLRDGHRTQLDTLIRTFPEGTDGCGVGVGSFNPTASEVVIQIACDNGHDYMVTSIAVFDYVHNEMTVLDTLMHMTNCMRPSYSSDGRRIAFLSNQVLYFLEREVGQ